MNTLQAIMSQLGLGGAPVAGAASEPSLLSRMMTTGFDVAPNVSPPPEAPSVIKAPPAPGASAQDASDRADSAYRGMLNRRPTFGRKPVARYDEADGNDPRRGGPSVVKAPPAVPNNDMRDTIQLHNLIRFAGRDKALEMRAKDPVARYDEADGNDPRRGRPTPGGQGGMPSVTAAVPGVITGGQPVGPAADQAQALAMFQERQQNPTASHMPAGSSGVGGPSTPFETTVQPAQRGIMEMLAGLKDDPTASALVDILNGAMRGAAMNVNNPRGMGIGAFGAGYTSAQDHVSKRDKEKAAAEAARQKLQFDQTMAVRKDSREERGAGRADEELELKRAKTDAEIQKMTRGLSSGIPGLSMKDAQKLNDQLNRYGLVLKDKVFDMKELKRLVEDERDRLLKDYLPPDKVPGGQQGGLGQTKEAPAKPMSRQEFDSLPSKAWFVNPKDGRILQKQ